MGSNGIILLEGYIMKPLIIINFKTYKESISENAVSLAKAAEEVAGQTGVPVSVAVQAADIFRVKSAVNIDVFAQHIDPAGFGAFTGAILPEAAQAAGAIGSLVNHSEKRMDHEIIGKTVERMKALGMKSIVCSKDATESEELARFKPDFIAYEPPELIGGDVSVSSAAPEVIEETVKRVKAVSPDTQVLAGAGVKTKEDIDVALRLGAVGVLLASGVTKAENPKEAILGLIE
ncbi:MAG: triose-phosphate isomerase [Candidatus Aenigmarchaeota archaeon]|nr:triose-phosphate isomerase [Candidatus Aenigmarchaeota archaeon]